MKFFPVTAAKITFLMLSTLSEATTLFVLVSIHSFLLNLVFRQSDFVQLTVTGCENISLTVLCAVSLAWLRSERPTNQGAVSEPRTNHRPGSLDACVMR